MESKGSTREAFPKSFFSWSWRRSSTPTSVSLAGAGRRFPGQKTAWRGSSCGGRRAGLGDLAAYFHGDADSAVQCAPCEHRRARKDVVAASAWCRAAGWWQQTRPRRRVGCFPPGPRSRAPCPRDALSCTDESSDRVRDALTRQCVAFEARACVCEISWFIN